MAKKGPIGKAEAFYIENKISSLDVDTIAKDLDRTKAAVQKYIDKNGLNKKVPNTGDQFSRQDGVTIMTENASTMIDANRKTNQGLPSLAFYQ